jgi:beta-lactamase regulating signal transducer with metallopeptidase domain
MDGAGHAAALWTAAMARACGQGSLIIALVWAAGRLVPRLSPAARCWLWRLAFLKLLAALVWARAIDLPVWPGKPGAGWLDPLPLLGPGLLPDGERVLVTAAEAPVISLPELLAMLWLLGVGVYAVRFLAQCRQTRRRRADCEPLAEEWLIAECRTLAERLGLRRAPELLVAAGSGSPWLVGIRAPAIIWPAALLAGCGENELRLMLAHELAHLRQRDLVWGWLGTVAQALFFFHPLVWLAGGEWRLAQEMACDAIAMAITRAPAAEYGGVLLKVAAQRPPDFRGGPVTVGVIESYHTLKRRLIAMKSFGTLSPLRLGRGGVGLVALAVLALLPWRVVAGEPGPERVKIVFVGPARGDILDLARRSDVQAHLQLNAPQRNAFAELQSRLEGFGLEERSLGEEGLSEQELKARLAERRARIEAARAEMIQQLPTILTSAQLQRLRELFVQWRGPLGLADPQTADAVGLSPAHRAHIAQILASLNVQPSEPMRVIVRREAGPEQRISAQKALEEGEGSVEKRIAEERARRDDAAARVVAVLDAGERARWNALQGAPFAFSREAEIHAADVIYREVKPGSGERP